MIVDRLSSHLAEPTLQPTRTRGGAPEHASLVFYFFLLKASPCVIISFLCLPYKIPYIPSWAVPIGSCPFFLSSHEFHVQKRTEQSNPGEGRWENSNREQGSITTNFNIRTSRVSISTFWNDHSSGKHVLEPTAVFFPGRDSWF